MAVPTDINTPNVPPPCNMDFPTRPMSSLPRKPALKSFCNKKKDIQVKFGC